MDFYVRKAEFTIYDAKAFGKKKVVRSIFDVKSYARKTMFCC